MANFILRILEKDETELEPDELNWSRDIKYFETEDHLNEWLDEHTEYRHYEVYKLVSTTHII